MINDLAQKVSGFFVRSSEFITFLTQFLCLAPAPIAYQTSEHLPTISQHRFASLTVFPLSQSILLQFVRR
jgi:hypothetical protein